MKPALTAILYCMMLHLSATAQNVFKAKITNSSNKEVLPGATASINGLKLAANADSNGIVVIRNIPDGKFEVQVSFTGYGKLIKWYTFPLAVADTTIEIALETSGELAEIIVETTRSSQNLRNIPTRIEALPREELDEKTTMRPGDIKMLLGEATGIHIQQASAVSGNANFRMQGLDSRYTQLLQNGMPLYAGFSGSLSLLQVSPLDLKQVEFIKGSASTLYGGGAVAGLINLITKTPAIKPELVCLLNGTSAKGFDASSFYSQQWKRVGISLFGAYNYSNAYDPSSTGFTAIPQTHRVSFNPKIFFKLNNHNAGWLGINMVNEDRYGGDRMVVSNGKPIDSMHQYFERNKTFRFSTQLSFTHTIDDNTHINFKNSVGYFNRRLTGNDVAFAGKQVLSFSEINYVSNRAKSNWIIGANAITDELRVQPPANHLNYSITTIGAFGLNTFKPVRWFSLETGLRLEHNTPVPANAPAGLFLLPKINTLFILDKHFTARLGGGFGYKMPGIFSDETEQYGVQKIKMFSISNVQAERSYGINADLNYRGRMGDEASIIVNQAFFYTVVQHPLMVKDSFIINAPGHLLTRGSETNVKLVIDELVFYLGYTFTHAEQHFNGQVAVQPLTPRHQLNVDATYEIENRFRFGVESFYTSPQVLNDGTSGRGFVTFGLLVQKMWKHLDIFLNFENITDQRQTRWGAIYSGSISYPVFRDIYAPLDGRLVNLGVRIKAL